MQKMIDYAYLISNGDENFVYTLEGENHEWTITRKHITSYYCPLTKTRETDYGMGISKCYHRKIVEDPRFFTDWHWHLDEAWRLYSTGTVFYGKKHIAKMKKKYQIIYQN